jgi:hypothetical protein
MVFGLQKALRAEIENLRTAQKPVVFISKIGRI